jgi:hypothetical protein
MAPKGFSVDIKKAVGHEQAPYEVYVDQFTIAETKRNTAWLIYIAVRWHTIDET